MPSAPILPPLRETVEANLSKLGIDPRRKKRALDRCEDRIADELRAERAAWDREEEEHDVQLAQIELDGARDLARDGANEAQYAGEGVRRALRLYLRYGADPVSTLRSDAASVSWERPDERRGRARAAARAAERMAEVRAEEVDGEEIRKDVARLLDQADPEPLQRLEPLASSRKGWARVAEACQEHDGPDRERRKQRAIALCNDHRAWHVLDAVLHPLLTCGGLA